MYIARTALTLPPNPGRTTFVNTLCGQDVLNHKDSDDPANAHVEEGVRIKPVTVGTILDPVSAASPPIEEFH